MIQETKEQEPTYNETLTLYIGGPKKIGVQYIKRFDDGKQFGHMNDFQDYDNLSIETVVKLIIAKKIPFSQVKRIQRCKNFNTYINVINELKDWLNRRGAN